jgi:hypothetical protein
MDMSSVDTDMWAPIYLPYSPIFGRQYIVHNSSQIVSRSMTGIKQRLVEKCSFTLNLSVLAAKQKRPVV